MPALYLVKAGVVGIVFILIWIVGDIILFSTGGVGTVCENIQPGYFYGLGDALKVFWGFIFPIMMCVVVAVYVLISSHAWEPLQS